MAKILIVDDNEGFCETIEDILFAEGYDVFRAGNGKEALKRLYTVSPDLMIIDITLSDMTGEEVCKKVKNDEFYKNVPILLMSGKIAEETPEKTPRETDWDEYIPKPFDMKKLLNKINNLLENK